MSFALTISGLSKTYPNGVQALNDVSLTIPAGMFGLLGPNGAGKSTLMRTLATLQEADAGSVALDDIDVLREKDACGALLGYLPQEFGVYPEGHRRGAARPLRACSRDLGDRRRDATVSMRCCGRPTSATCARRRWAASRAACGSASASRRRCSATRASSSSTSRPPASIPRSACASTTCSPRSART